MQTADGNRVSSRRVPLGARLSQVPDDWQSVVAWRGATSVTEQEFRRRADGWRNWVAANGAGSVAIHESDGAEFAAALFGTWAAGRTAILPGSIVADACRSLRERGVTLVGSFPAEHGALRSPPDGAADAIFEPLDPEKVSAVIYTSGSTGAPQALSKRLRQLAAEVETLERQFGGALGMAHVTATVSHQHIYGLLFKILWPLWTGRPFDAISVDYPEELAPLIARGPSVLVSSPAHLKRLPERGELAGAREHLRAVFSSGGPLPLEAGVAADRTLGVTPVEVYGSSETGGVAWRQCVGGIAVAWTPLPGVEVRVTDAAFSVRSPHLPDPQWFDLADKVELQDDGRFLLAGRTDRIAKVEGKRVSLAGIEAALVATGLVREAGVVMVAGIRDTIAAALVPSEAGWDALRADGTAAVQRRLAAALESSVERVARPRRWRWLEQLPVNAQAKVTADALNGLFSADGPTMPCARVRVRTDTKAELDLLVPPSLRYFEGHFEGAPVLPGVVQLAWAVEYGRRVFGGHGDFLRMEAVKFQKVYQPGPLLMLQLEWRADHGTIVFRFTSNTGVHSSGRLVFST